MSALGSRHDHHRFCQVEGWAEVHNARGKKVGHHLTFELELADGRVLRTRISRPADKTTYGPSLWGHILGDQLGVTEAEFWECVSNRNPPQRGDVVEVPTNALPAQLVYQLLHEAGVPESEVRAMSLAQATEVMVRHWSQQR